MKKHFSKLLLTLLIAMMAITGCSNETALNENLEKKASLTISLGNSPQTRAVGAVRLEKEKVIKSMIVLIFNGDNLEHRQALMGNKGVIKDLSVGPRNIKIIANPAPNVTEALNKVVTIDQLNNLKMSLSDEWNQKGEMADKGFTMTGEKNITLKAGDNNEASIIVKRIVAKVILGKIDIKFIEGYNSEDFEIVSIAMMKVRSNSLLGFGGNYLLKELKKDYSFMGGHKGVVTTITETRLIESLTKPTTNPYFYVTPNDDSNDNATVMTLAATYKGKPQYFVFRINDKEVKGSESITGDYIQANRQYRLNIVIKKPFGEDIEKAKEDASIEVTVIPEDWVVVPDQNVTF